MDWKEDRRCFPGVEVSTMAAAAGFMGELKGREALRTSWKILRLSQGLL
jgi:hypothetical protein